MPAAALAQGVALPEIQVIATSPLAGGEIERDKVPAMVQTLTAEDFARTGSPSVTEALQQNVPGVHLSDVQGNGLAQDLRYRGFAASPVQGTPQGLAVYQNGIRVNEAFGDTVNWDLIPPIAIERADVFTNNPVFGLNALGGAVNVQMKNGFTYNGFGAELQGGSFGRISGALQYGAQKDGIGVYFAADGLHDDGWRFHSPAELARLYFDIGAKGERAEIHLIASAASNFLGVIGPTPVELLRQDYRSVFTWPQTTLNQMGMLALNGKFALDHGWSLQSNAYVRRFHQQHVDGNAGNFERCSADSSYPDALCLQREGFPAPMPVTPAFLDQFVILNRNNNPIPFAGADVPYGTLDRTRTDAITFGGSLQAVNDAKLFEHGNRFTVGASIDHSRIAFSSNSELGFIFPDLFVGPNPAVPGTGQPIHTLGNVGLAPVGLGGHNTYYGLYAVDTFDITPQLSATLGARANLARIELQDVLGTAPELTGTHMFSRINPLAGLTYKLFPGLSVYGGYSEANRAPTPLELGCADPNRPCLLESFVVADPPLKQVVSNTYDAGLRGNLPLNGGRLDWKLGVFRTDSFDDILAVASPVTGRGFFQNVPQTRRQGLEAGAAYRDPRWFAYANYAFVDATFQFEADLPSPNNPAADADGKVHVVPGNHIPAIPQHQLKVGAEYAVTPEWKVGADVIAVGPQFYFGDYSNVNEKLPAYWVANLRTSYQITKELQLFALVNNLFNEKYATYGRYFDTGSLANAIALTLADPRMQTPAQPLSIYAGLRLKY
jgi:iron complex outermembrane receptor protein